jgi:hypothetical protein
MDAAITPCNVPEGLRVKRFVTNVAVEAIGVACIVLYRGLQALSQRLSGFNMKELSRRSIDRQYLTALRSLSSAWRGLWRHLAEENTFTTLEMVLRKGYREGEINDVDLPRIANVGRNNKSRVQFDSVLHHAYRL